MSLTTLMSQALPLNRKEKYYTGTVFPGIVCSDDFRHFNVFANLLPGSPRFTVEPHPASTNIQFFTEYSPLHSFVGAAKARMLEIPASNETPDVAVILDGQPDRVLIVLEAKVFDSTSGSELSGQLRKQEAFINCVKVSLGIERVYHAALIPEGLLKTFGHFSYPVVTWDALRDAYAHVVPNNYFLHVLSYALEGFESLRSASNQIRGQNADDKVTGGEIERLLEQGFIYRTMGRIGGFHGPDLRKDLETGRWRSFPYEVRRDPEPLNRNWFLVNDFVAAVRSGGSTDIVRTKLATKGKMAGAEILRQYKLGALWYRTVGRNRGLHGPEFAQDVRTGGWATHKYEVSTDPVPENRNWFIVEDFAGAVGRREGT